MERPTRTHYDSTMTHNDPQRPTTTPLQPHYDPVRWTMTHNDPLRPHNDPTTIHNDPLRPHYDPTTSHDDQKTSHNDPQVHNNPTTISTCASGSFAFPANFDHMC
jgi:protein xylosyltransferase